MITYPDFAKVEIRVGRIIEVNDFPEAKKPAYQLLIDFGPEVGTRRSSAQLTKHYSKKDLMNKLVMAVVNLPPRRIGEFVSDVLTLGVPDETGECVLITPDKIEARLGGQMY